jgi:hypothetical protein
MPSPPVKPPPLPIVMSGGAREQMIDIVKKYAQPLNVYIGILLVLGIIYIGRIPKTIAFRANTLLGRIVLFALTILVAETYSWNYALLMALFTVLLIAVAPRTFREPFKNAPKMVKESNTWFIERVLKENPSGIEDDEVETSAIQDSGNDSPNSTTSSR